MHYQRWLKHGDPNTIIKNLSPAKDWIIENKNYTKENCLIWPFATGADGYGRVHRTDGTLTTSSNYMCELVYGPKPTPQHETAHNCGQGHLACTNPKHLRWALPKENHADKIGHGTTNRGTRQGRSKLTDDDIRSIRILAGSMKLKEIAILYKVGPDHISRIVSRQVWKYLD